MSDQSDRALTDAIARLLDVHRGWCNYCEGHEPVCDTRPECSAREVKAALARERATAPAPAAPVTVALPANHPVQVAAASLGTVRELAPGECDGIRYGMSATQKYYTRHGKRCRDDYRVRAEMAELRAIIREQISKREAAERERDDWKRKYGDANIWGLQNCAAWKVRAEQAEAALAAARADAERLEFVLPMLCGTDNPEADARTIAVGQALMSGLDGRAAIDHARAAMKGDEK